MSAWLMPTGGRAPSLLSIFTTRAGRVRRASSSVGSPVSGNVGRPAVDVVVPSAAGSAASGSSLSFEQAAANSTIASRGASQRHQVRPDLTSLQLLESGD